MAFAGHSRFFFAAAEPLCVAFAYPPRKKHPTRAAFDFACEWVCGVLHCRPAFHLCLNLCVGLTVNDGFVAVCHVILRQLTVILYLCFLEGGCHVAFLPADIARIDLVKNHLPHGAFLKFIPKHGADSRTVHAVRNIPQGNPVYVHLEHPADSLRLFGDNDVLFLFLVIPIAKQMFVCHADLPGLEPLSDAPFTVFRDRTALFLCKGCQE